MPQLQNNNRTPIKSNNGNIPRNSSYINEVKTARDYKIPSNYSTILNGVSDVLNNVNDKLRDFTLKTQQIEAENKFNEFQTQLNNKTNEYKINYEKNPNENLTKDYEADIKNLKDNYERQMPGLYKNNFLQRVKQINKAQNLDFFRKTADLNHQSKKYIESLNNSLYTVNIASYQGNYDAMNNEVLNLPLKKQQLISLYGDLDGNQIYNDYTKKLIKNYMGGRIASNNPKDVLDITKVIEMTPEFKDKLTAEEIEHYKEIANDKMERIEKARKTQEMTEYAIKTNMIINDIANEKLNNYEDIVNRLLEMGTDEYESKLVMKIAGYSTELPPELLNRNRNNNKTDNKYITDELNRKKSNAEKIQYKTNLQEQIFSFFEGIVDKDGNHNKDKALKEENNRNTVANRIKDVEMKLLEGVAGGYITGAEHSNFANQLQSYYTEVLEATAKGNFDDDKWYSLSIGYDDLKNEIEKILESNNLNTNPDNLKGLDKEKYYFIKNNIMSNFNNSMEKQLKEAKDVDINGKYKNVNNWIDFQKYIDKSSRKNMYNRAIKDAITKYAQNELKIDITKYIDKSTNTINKDAIIKDIKQDNEIKILDAFYSEY